MTRRQRRKARDADSGQAAEARDRPDEGMRFSLRTGIYAALGLLFAGFGFVLLGHGSINLAPVLLLIGFFVFFPLALVK